MAKYAITVFDVLDSVAYREPINIVVRSSVGHGLYGHRVHRVVQLCDAMVRLGLITKKYNLGGVPQYRKPAMNKQAFIKILEERKCR